MAYLLLSLFFRQKGVLPFSLAFTALLLSAVIVMTSSHRVREVERFSAVEYAASRHDWPRVLRRATPEATRDDRQLLPYALLALTESGQLPDRMMRYPVRTVDDFCPESWSDRRGLAFKACLYECMGIPGEAIHNTFQAATALPHGSSFGTLRALVRLNRLKGDERLAHKYATILSHSTLHKGWGKDIPLNEALEQSASDRQSAILNSSQAPLITLPIFIMSLRLSHTELTRRRWPTARFVDCSCKATSSASDRCTRCFLMRRVSPCRRSIAMRSPAPRRRHPEPASHKRWAWISMTLTNVVTD